MLFYVEVTNHLPDARGLYLYEEGWKPVGCVEVSGTHTTPSFEMIKPVLEAYNVVHTFIGVAVAPKYPSLVGVVTTYVVIGEYTQTMEKSTGLSIEEPLTKEVTSDTPTCPKCHYTRLASFSSLGYKQCTKCNTKIPWILKENQEPLVKYQR